MRDSEMLDRKTRVKENEDNQNQGLVGNARNLQTGDKASVAVTGTGNTPLIARNKVILKPGRSLMDWIKLGKSGKDLSGTKGKVLQITPAELALHNKDDDAWMVINGKVYNVTPYMEFHPGGVSELMRGAGIDGTQLFNEVHRWVNYESMLASCYVGKLLPAAANTNIGTSLHTEERRVVNSLKVPAFAESSFSPWYSWSQTETTVTISIHADKKAVESEQVIIDKLEKSFHLQLLLNDCIYYVQQELEDTLDDFQVNKGTGIGTVDVVLKKKIAGRELLELGSNRTQLSLLNKSSDAEVAYRQCTVNSVSSVSHDTKLYCIEYPPGRHVIVPVGCHVFLRFLVEGIPISRAYTVVPASLQPSTEAAYTALGRVVYLMIKTYPDGLLTSIIDRLNPGDKLDVSAKYYGTFNKSRLNSVSHLIMYAAGTGFTPMASILQYYRQHLNTSSSLLSYVQLVFFNKQEKDILWKEELDKLSSSLDRFSVDYILSDPHLEWKGLTGHINKEMMENLSPKPKYAQDVLLCICGPTQFTLKVTGFANELGFTDDMIHAFTS